MRGSVFLVLVMWAIGVSAGLSACQMSPRPAQAPHQQPFGRPMLLEDEGATCYSDACFRPVKFINGKTFYLQGVSVRRYFLFDVYSGGFYLSDERASLQHGVPEGAKLLILEYHRHVPKERIVESIQHSVHSNSHVAISEVQPRFDELTEAFEEPRKGARYYFAYVPGEGTRLIQNGETAVTIPGEDFAFAFFGVWLAEEDADHMRKELLGV